MRFQCWWCWVVLGGCVGCFCFIFVAVGWIFCVDLSVKQTETELARLLKEISEEKLLYGEYMKNRSVFNSTPTLNRMNTLEKIRAMYEERKEKEKKEEELAKGEIFSGKPRLYHYE